MFGTGLFAPIYRRFVSNWRGAASGLPVGGGITDDTAAIKACNASTVQAEGGTMLLNIGGQDFTFAGEPGDFYFDNLSAFSQGAGEQQLGRYATRHLRTDSTCLDVGANIGLTAVMLSSSCPRGHVYAFEPSPKNAAYLQQNITGNKITNVSVIEAAIGATAGRVRLNMPTVGANSTVIRRPQNGSSQGSEVPMITLDAWSAGLDRKIDFIKLDVEGYEANVLAGAADLIARWRPPIFMEFNSVTIAGEARRSPVCFAETLWRVFDVSSVNSEGNLEPAGGGAVGQFVLQNMVHHGCIDDVMLVLKPDVDATQLRAALLHEVEASAAAQPH